MPVSPNDPSPQSETSERLTERGRGKAERVVLGRNPFGTMVRIVVAVLLFILIAGSVFYFIRQ